MTVSKRDTRYHTYADYYVWSRTYGDELAMTGIGRSLSTSEPACWKSG